MSPLNILGLLVCLGGILFHVVHKVLYPPPPPSDTFEDFGEEIHIPLLDVGKNVAMLDDAINLETSTDEEDEDVIFSVLNRPGR